MRPASLGFLVLGVSLLSAPLPVVGQDAGDTATTPAAHFPRAPDLRRLVVLGDALRTRVLAEAILADEEAFQALPGAARLEVEALQNALHRTVDAANMDDLTFAVAETGTACAACHETTGLTGSASPALMAPEPEEAEDRHTTYLASASRLLWHGLSTPSDQAWRAGTEALVGSDGFPVPTARHVPEEVNAEAAAELERLATQAVPAVEPRTRADLAARIWATCADCHVPAGVGR